MKKRQIVNIINFIRGVEPRLEKDILTPVKNQIALMKKHHLRGTFLLQYDALLMAEYTDLLRALDPTQFELGVWHEIVQPQAEACGIPWRGRYSWDWHCHCGFPVGYTATEREKLVDVLFEKFRDVFGYYPRVFGSWFFDSHTARYMCDRYEIDAMCNCKEQCGTDGYTLWGGYYGQGYYPCRNNVFFPAHTADSGLPTPLFRMLGSDPVYQYDAGMDIAQTATPSQSVYTLEPSYPHGGGGDARWVDWYMHENFNGECLSFGYAQAGQENSFGWELMGKGLEHQFPLFEQLQSEGHLCFEPLGETGRWYKRTYTVTPASTITAHGAYDDDRKSSVWYSGRFYRINLYNDEHGLRIRDLHLFSEQVNDPYESILCTENAAAYETLPVIDGFRHTGYKTVAGGFFAFENGHKPDGQTFLFREEADTALIDYDDLHFTLTENTVTISADRPFTLVYRYGKTDDHFPKATHQSERALTLVYNDVPYTILASEGRFVSSTTIASENNRIVLTFKA